VGGFEYDERSHACPVGFTPAANAEAPAVTGEKTGEAEFGAGGAQIIAARVGKSEKFGGHHGADGMGAGIVGAGFAAAVTVKSGERGGRAGEEWLAEDVAGGFAVGHGELKG